ncbi:GNAT family N-acetyltransferase [Streptomyces phaeochromogenes]|uniref:GNAT family N-acetyltransferase n=1 Tax=Streptomyces phaeochromogenes TaxID=1923 RepID=UPI00386A78E7|nr:GNAT family N-acetyltransferase [Streptomyces phaeochromogenes]
MPPSLTTVRPEDAFALVDGTIMYPRLATVDDYPLVEELHARCSSVSLASLYAARRPAPPQTEWRRAAEIPRNRVLLVTPEGRSDHVVAMASVAEVPNAPEVGDVAILVADQPPDAYQSRGLGTRLADLLAEAARNTGFGFLTIKAPWTNWRMLLIVEHLGGPALPQTPYMRNMALLGLLPNADLDVADEIELRIAL